MMYIFTQSLHKPSCLSIFTLIQKKKKKLISESIVILSSYTVYCSRIDAKSFGWAPMILLSHLFVKCEQLRFRPKKKVKVKVSHSVVAVWTAGGRGGGGGGQRP